MGWTAVVAALGGGIGGLFLGWLGSGALRRAHPPAPLPRGWCELGTAVLCALVSCYLTWRGTPLAAASVPLVTAALAVPLTLSDLWYRRLPDHLTLAAYPLLAVAVTVTALTGPGGDVAVRAVLAAVLFGGLHAGFRAVAPTAMGAGDVKLAGSVGGVLGVSGWLALPLAAVIAAVVSLLLSGVAACRCRRRSGVPYGPGLLTGAVLTSAVLGVG